MCRSKGETVAHVVSECGKLAQTEYKGRHDKVAGGVSIGKSYGINRSRREW